MLSFLLAANRHTPAMLSLTNAQIRELKARGQLLKPTLKVGKEGLTPQFFAALDEALKHHDLLKVKFADLKDQKKELAPQLAEKSGSHLVLRVGTSPCYIARSQRRRKLRRSDCHWVSGVER